MEQRRIEDLMARWDDPWKPTRNEAAKLLADAGPPVVPAMERVLLCAQPDPDHAHYAVWVLEQIDTPEAEAILAEYWRRHG
jgi:hypothetical protein